MHAFGSPSIQEAEADGPLSSRPALVFQASSKTAKAVSRNKTRQTNKQKSPVICSYVYVTTVGRNMEENVFLGNMKPRLLDLS